MAWWQDLLDSLLDRRCSGCMGRVPRDREVCDACDATVPRSGTLLCLSCLHGDGGDPRASGGACLAHGSRRLALAGPPYEPALERILHAFKYEGARRLAPWIAALFPEPPDRGGPLGLEAVIVPVALHPARRARRGFDQADVLAEGVSLRWGVPIVRALERVRDHEPQARLGPARRRENVRGAFRATGASLVRGRPVLLLDDVVTTGSTLLEAADALEGAGAGWILGLAAAHGGRAEGPEAKPGRAIAGTDRLW